MKLEVFAERDGERQQVGSIETVQAAGERFAYCESWLESADPRPISFSLPLQRNPFPAKKMRPYFDGLLPEGAAREAIAKAAKTSPRAYVKLLAALGDECIGAVSFSTPGEIRPAGYKALSEAELNKLSRRTYQGTTPLIGRTHMSLAGAQAKVGLYQSADGDWYEPHGGAPSTHIVKPLNPRFENVQINEAICQKAAGELGLPVPDTTIIPTEIPMLCTKRFDRYMETGKAIDGLQVPARLHQEDFCQALGVVPERKYETSNRHELARVASLLRDHSVDPISDLRSLWAFVVFNFLIGNCDAHLKNIGIVRDMSWHTVRLAPFYDLVCTQYYEDLEGTMALSIGGKRKLEDIDRAAFERESETLALSSRDAERIMGHIKASIPDAIRDAANSIAAAGYKHAIPMGDTIATAAELRGKRL